MRKLALLAAVATLAILPPFAANADGVITFQYSEGVGPTTTVNTGFDIGNIGPIVLPGYVIGSLSAITNPLLPLPDLLQANQISVSSNGAADSLNLTVIASGLTSPFGLTSLVSSFSAAAITAGWSVYENTDINGILLSQTTLLNSSGLDLASMFDLTNPFSASAHFVISSNGIAGSSNSTIGLKAVPGPELGALASLPALFAMGGGGLWWRRKRRVA